MVARYLFARHPVNRVEAQTDVENIAEQRALEKAGFVREGVLRGSQFRAGGYHDLVSYSVLRDEVEGDWTWSAASDPRVPLQALRFGAGSSGRRC